MSARLLINYREFISIETIRNISLDQSKSNDFYFLSSICLPLQTDPISKLELAAIDGELVSIREMSLPNP